MCDGRFHPPAVTDRHGMFLALCGVTHASDSLLTVRLPIPGLIAIETESKPDRLPIPGRIVIELEDMVHCMITDHLFSTRWNYLLGHERACKHDMKARLRDKALWTFRHCYYKKFPNCVIPAVYSKTFDGNRPHDFFVQHRVAEWIEILFGLSGRQKDV